MTFQSWPDHVLYLWSESCLQSWRAQTAQGRKMRDAGPETPHRARGPLGPRWTARALLNRNWNQASDNDVSERGEGWGGINGCCWCFNVSLWVWHKYHKHTFIFLLTGSTVAGNSCLLRSPSNAPGRLWLTGLPDGESESEFFQLTLDEVMWRTEPEKCLTLNAEEVLSCMHGQTLLVAGRRQCRYVTKVTRHRNATEYPEYRSRMQLWLYVFQDENTSALFCVSFPLHGELSLAARRAGVSLLGVPGVFHPSSLP